MINKCRIWWPNQAVSLESSSNYILFGWFMPSSLESMDVVVAFVSPEMALLSNQSQLQEDLRRTNASLPSFLQDEILLCPLGLFSADPNCTLRHPRVTLNSEQSTLFGHINSYQNGEDAFDENDGSYSCNCEVTNEALLCSFSSRDHKWIRLVGDSQNDFCAAQPMPMLHHVHWNGKILSNFDVHVILYEVPTFGVYHLRSSFLSNSEQLLISLKTPKWLSKLNKQSLINLDTTIHAINCVAAAKTVFHGSVCSKRYIQILPPVAFVMASFSTVFYIVLQLFHKLLDCASCWRINGMLAKVFCTTWISISIRCSQFLYWPVYLGYANFRSSSCVEWAEKSALQRHSLWTSLIVDIFLGNAVGLALLIKMESVRLWTFAVVGEITNNLLRSGCVWLMGVPAGFKLNTELATVLGMISLNTIQIWSTLWFYASFIFDDILRGLAILGMVFGITTTAAFIKDMIELVVFHVTALHWGLSLIYAWQLQSIASLWRLFRGQKWNPLRQRLDNYDYTVEQHIVGSLLFTPLLLLLPTTSVFYIFFSLVSASISVVCLLIEIFISVVHATPYLKILLWVVSPRRFASGIWFKVETCGNRNNHSHSLPNSQQFSKISKSSNAGTHCLTALVSQLQNNCLTFGELIFPHYKLAFSQVSPSFLASAVRGLFTGKRFPRTLGAGFPAKHPWYFISPNEFWHLFYDSVVARSEDGHT